MSNLSSMAMKYFSGNQGNPKNTLVYLHRDLKCKGWPSALSNDEPKYHPLYLDLLRGDFCKNGPPIDLSHLSFHRNSSN